MVDGLKGPDSSADHLGMDERDQWEQVGQTLDWVAGLVAAWADREPADLVWPTVAVGLAAGLAAEMLNATTGSTPALVWVGVALTLCGFGMLGLLAHRFRRSGSSGGARTAESQLLSPWLRRLQVLMAAAVVAVVALMVLGAVTGSWVMVVRNALEVGRVGGVVLAISFLLLDDEVGLPDWLASRVRTPAAVSTDD